MNIELHYKDGSYLIVTYVQSFRLRSEFLIIDTINPVHEYKFTRDSLDYFTVRL